MKRIYSYNLQNSCEEYFQYHEESVEYFTICFYQFLFTFCRLFGWNWTKTVSPSILTWSFLNNKYSMKIDLIFLTSELPSNLFFKALSVVKITQSCNDENFRKSQEVRLSQNETISEHLKILS